MAYDVAWLQGIEANYLVTSNFCFDRYFNTPEPPRTNPLYREFMHRKAFYAALFAGAEKSGWQLAGEFDTGKGPRVLVYRKAK